MLTFIFISVIYCKSLEESSFSFITNVDKRHTLFHHVFTQKELLSNQGHWYYVHFLVDDYSDFQSFIKILPSNEIIKNTFLLFLNSKQVQMISNVSLIKKLVPEEKFDYVTENIDEADQLLVLTTDDFELPVQKEYYSIENKKRNGSFIITINQINLDKKKEMINYLENIAEVQSISIYKQPFSKNAIATGFSQKNRFDFKKDPDSFFYHLDRYLNNEGLTGKNEVITLYEKPIDFYHPMFRDDAFIEKQKDPLVLDFGMTDHRKFVYYTIKDANMEMIKKQIHIESHGSHVAGIIAGKNIYTDKTTEMFTHFDGIAPDAKILYAGKYDTMRMDVLKQKMNYFKSRVFSNSWGGENNNDAFNYNEMAVDNDFGLIIFACGNEYVQKGNFSIDILSGAKNILTVGAISDFYSKKDEFIVTSKNDPNKQITTNGINFTSPWFEGTIGAESGKTDILAIDLSKKDCNLFKNNKMFLGYGDSYSWVSTCVKEIKNFIWTKDSAKVKELLKSGSDVLITQNAEMDTSQKVERALYSSTGPTKIGLLKPDLLAPGTDIVSARPCSEEVASANCSDYTKNLYKIDKGTSMSAPNVAGSAALIHQYFREGKWVPNSKTSKNLKDLHMYDLDSSTIRALLINSCKHPLGSKTPDITYGHGVIDLSTIIPIKNDFGVQLSGQKKYSLIDSDENDERPSVNIHDHVVAKLEVKNKNTKLQITLSYLDRVINKDSPIPLAHDLDLVVESPSKKIFLGDHLQNGDTQHASTNEKIIINEDELEVGEYKIHVYAGAFVGGKLINKKHFSVVATGPIINDFLSFEKQSDCPCDKCDQDHSGYCLCDSDKEVGPVCQGKIETINGDKASVTVGPLEVKRLKFISNNNITYINSKSANPGRGVTIWSDKTCHLSIGEYSHNGKTGENKYETTKVDYENKEACVAIFNNNYESATYDIEVSDMPKPTPTPSPKKKSGGCSKKNDAGIEKINSKVLGNFKIQKAYLGLSSSVYFNFKYFVNLMHNARKLFGHLIPPPDFVHSAIWVGESDADDSTVGAIFVYGKYYADNYDPSFLFNDGAQSYVMTLGEFKKKYNTVDAIKLNLQRSINLFEFIDEVKSNGKWSADEYNWPNNNCQHFTSKCIDILNAARYIQNKNDWVYLPKTILKSLEKNENKEL
ncbi:hypothetical protein M9Y10_018916 [Tritrichomonas musculus]|uniref:Peptidase S8/S53 domain-containing protein n=1 Tax=Tritrichomonas musculus TaxID=1915356 RepID=A0ABR2HJ09_9EUKA